MFQPRYAPDGTVLAPRLTAPAANGHKYDRGHAFIFSGPRHRTGAARLAAQACLRTGAGLVTVIGDGAALDEHAAHLTAIMLHLDDGVYDVMDQRTGAVAMGPGLGVGDTTRHKVLTVLEKGFPLVLDADAMTSFSDGAQTTLFARMHRRCVMTPHAGEFARLFPDVDLEDRQAAVCQAAVMAGAVVLLKGAQTHIASPDGQHAVSRHATPWLATAGAGDVLTGIITGLLSQGASAFDAAAMGAWLHGDAGRRGGAGMTADDLPAWLLATLQALTEDRES